MQLWPAIDLINGKCVRLFKGDYAQKTEYNFSLQSLADDFSAFATGIHVVDLDGAKAGHPVNQLAIQEIIQYAKVPVEVGGGIRSFRDIETVLSWGVSRIILGTKALEKPDFIDEVLEKFGSEKIVIGVDAKDGMVATHGWETASSYKAEDFMKLLEQKGVKTVIFTDIATDGTLAGPPLKTFTHLCQTFPKIDIIASGGIACMQDIANLKTTGVKGCIFGKAWYEGKITKQQITNNNFSL